MGAVALTMAVFEIGRPIVTDKPFVRVENRLKEGPHDFQLVVVNQQRVRSDAAVVRVMVTSDGVGTRNRLPLEPLQPLRPLDAPDPVRPQPLRPGRPPGTPEPE